MINMFNKQFKKISYLFIAMVLGICISFSLPIYADDAPPDTINTFSLALTVGEHYFDYMNFKVIGACMWWHWDWFDSSIYPTPEVEEYLPDMIVTVYNEAGDDPWTIARISLDKAAQATGNLAMRSATGYKLTEGRSASVSGEQQNYSYITKSVDVIGSPMNLLRFPFLMLRPDTTSFVPYYQSALDSVPSRMGLAESIRPESWNPVGHYIGKSFINHWAYEFPRTMSVESDNDYKASVSIALHAADIVTNRNTLHIVHSTSDSCGKSCAVSNVIEENNDDHEVWEEVYPNDHHVNLGESDLSSRTPLGQSDIKAGHGNYVFVVWRKYRGCIQGDGHLMFATTHIAPTNKR